MDHQAIHYYLLRAKSRLHNIFAPQSNNFLLHIQECNIVSQVAYTQDYRRIYFHL